MTIEREERNAMLTEVAEELEKVLPEHWGSLRFNFQNGRVVNVNIEESVRIRPAKPQIAVRT